VLTPIIAVRVLESHLITEVDHHKDSCRLMLGYSVVAALLSLTSWKWDTCIRGIKTASETETIAEIGIRVMEFVAPLQGVTAQKKQ